MASAMPLHLLPPHIKLQILNSMTAQPPATSPSPSASDTATSPASQTSVTSSSPSATQHSPSTPSAHFTTAPFFSLASLTATTPLPAPFTLVALRRLHTHGHCALDSFLPPPTTPPLHTLPADIGALLDAGAFAQGGMRAAGDKWAAADVRGDKVCWLAADRPTPPSVAHLLASLHSAMAALSGALGESWPCEASSSQMALYEPGGRYVRHLDVRRGGDGGPVRRLTAIVYLNDGWQAEWGGQLRLYERSGAAAAAGAGEGQASVDVLPVWGRLLLFASEEVEHEVLPATHRRVALTTWFK